MAVTASCHGIATCCCGALVVLPVLMLVVENARQSAKLASQSRDQSQRVVGPVPFFSFSLLLRLFLSFNRLPTLCSRSRPPGG